MEHEEPIRKELRNIIEEWFMSADFSSTYLERRVMELLSQERTFLIEDLAGKIEAKRIGNVVLTKKGAPAAINLQYDGWNMALSEAIEILRSYTPDSTN